MATEDNGGSAFLEAVEVAIAFGGPAHGVPVGELFDAAAEHVCVLLADAIEAFRRESFGTAVFLAITAMEETAKAEILAFRTVGPSDRLGRGRDPMRDHAAKHRLAVRPTTFMGRLPRLLGEERCADLKLAVETGKLVGLRECSLYVQVNQGGFATPSTAISKSLCREVLLLALEVAGDVLVGWTNRSYVLSKRFEAWLNELAGTEGST